MQCHYVIFITARWRVVNPPYMAVNANQWRALNQHTPSLRGLVIVIFGSGTAAVAESSGDYPALEQACAQNPDRCAELRAKMQAKCAEDPKACEERKARMEARIARFKEKCAADPQACEEKKARMQQRAAEWKAKCAADPAACEQKKAAMQKRFQERLDKQP